jgi:hypothetical protein
MSRGRHLLFLVLALTAVGCGSETPTTPSDPKATTESFSSIVQKNGTTTRSFTTTEQGIMTVTLTSLSQEAASVQLGVGLSDVATGQCTPTFSVVTSVYAGRALSVKADIGHYCILVSDIGELTNQANFSVGVTHF